MKKSLNDLIQDYDSCGMLQELSGMKNLEMACTCRYINAKGRERHCNHQRRVRRESLNAMYEALKLRHDELANAKDFEALYKIVEDQNIAHLGPMTKYDIAMHIGYISSPKVLPQKLVYLHRGAELGAKALYKNGLLTKEISRTMDVKDFDFLSELKNLDSAEHNIPEGATFAMIVEDFLCVMHEELEKL